MLSLNKPMTLTAALCGALAMPATQAATPPSVAGSSWNLSGKFTGKAKVKCRIGPSLAVPFKGPKTLSATIRFDDGEEQGDNAGTFVWTDEAFAQREITGHWEQDGAKLDMEFDHWYDSPIAAFAFALAQVPGDFDFSTDGINGSAGAFKVTKLSVGGSINPKASKIAIAESLAFSFDASASGYGGANTCSYQFKSLGRSYKGVSAP